MSYFKIKQTLAQVNKKDEILSNIDKWEAHKHGILHRGFTVILKYQDQYYLQHRKHLVFDNTFDLSFSSHQLIINGALESDKDSIIRNLNREFEIGEQKLNSKFLGSVYYKEKDKKSKFTEHEVDYIYEINLLKPIQAKSEYAYGLLLLPKDLILNKKNFIYKNLAPWAKKLLINYI